MNAAETIAFPNKAIPIRVICNADIELSVLSALACEASKATTRQKILDVIKKKINGKESELTRAEFFETKLVEIDAESAAKPGSEDNETEKQSAKFILSQIVTPLATLAKTLMFIYIWTSLNLVYFGMSLGK